MTIIPLHNYNNFVRENGRSIKVGWLESFVTVEKEIGSPPAHFHQSRYLWTQLPKVNCTQNSVRNGEYK